MVPFASATTTRPRMWLHNTTQKEGLLTTPQQSSSKKEHVFGIPETRSITCQMYDISIFTSNWSTLCQSMLQYSEAGYQTAYHHPFTKFTRSHSLRCVISATRSCQNFSPQTGIPADHIPEGPSKSMTRRKIICKRSKSRNVSTNVTGLWRFSKLLIFSTSAANDI